MTHPLKGSGLDLASEKESDLFVFDPEIWKESGEHCRQTGIKILSEPVWFFRVIECLLPLHTLSLIDIDVAVWRQWGGKNNASQKPKSNTTLNSAATIYVCNIWWKRKKENKLAIIPHKHTILISVSVSSPSLFLNQYAPHQAFDCFSVYCTVAHLL